MRILVQKFGGTSVAGADRRQMVADRVEAAWGEGYRVVVVVSAMGRQGDPYATDTLLGLAAAEGAAVTPRELDLLLSCGETIAAVVLGGVLRARGLPAVVLTGGQAGLETDDRFGAASILAVRREPLLQHLQAGRLPVVAGFQGISAGGEVTTLGRGGSDTTAAALGGALRAEAIEIFTDVDGIKTADPRIVPDARTLKTTTYDELAQMAHHGARIVHPRAVELAMQYNIPLRVRSTFDPGPGTLVTYTLEAATGAVTERRPQGVVTGVTHVPRLAQVTVSTAPGDARGLDLFRALADAGISIDLINVSPLHRTFCVEERHAAEARRILTDMGLAAEVRTGCAKVSVVGAAMRGRPGVMATVVEALARAGVEILQTADSHVTISCLVDGSDVEAAVRALHQGFGLGSGGT